MSSMLWTAAAAAAATPAPVTAEQLVDEARQYFSLVQPPRAECSQAEGDELVVCAPVVDGDEFRVPSDTARGVVVHEVPRAPDVSGLPDCSQTTCIKFGKQPRQVNLIDLSALPEAPAGSDADRIARGEMAAP